MSNDNNPLSERKGKGGLINSLDPRRSLKGVPMSTQHNREPKIGNIFELKNETSMTLNPQLSDGSVDHG